MTGHHDRLSTGATLLGLVLPIAVTAAVGLQTEVLGRWFGSAAAP